MTRQFDTGATRDADDNKLDYDGFLSSPAMVQVNEWLDRNRALAWAAGLFEGEGCITTNTSRAEKKYPRLTMSLTDEDTIRRFAGIVGGKVRGPYKTKHKPVWYWSACSQEEIQRISAELLPYLGQRRAARLFDVLGTIRGATATGFEPKALERYSQYMHQCRLRNVPSGQAVRSSDNWKKGIPLDAYMKSGYRHFMDWWTGHQAGQVDEDALCALLFNVQGYLHELLKESHGRKSNTDQSGTLPQVPTSQSFDPQV